MSKSHVEISNLFIKTYFAGLGNCLVKSENKMNLRVIKGINWNNKITYIKNTINNKLKFYYTRKIVWN